MNRHIITEPSRTLRETVEHRLLLRFKNVKIFEPDKDYHMVDRFKDNTYGFSNAAIALYYHGNSVRAPSKVAPFGLIWQDDTAIFPIGYFKKEEQGELESGYFHIGSPKGENALAKLAKFVYDAIRELDDLCMGAYVRFLDEKSASHLKTIGFQQVNGKNNTWNTRAPLEDETHDHSIVFLPNLIELKENNLKVKNLYDWENKGHKDHARRGVARFSNFLERNGLNFILEPITSKGESLLAEIEIAQKLVKTHFDFLIKSEKAVGSVWQDYLGAISEQILSIPSIHAFVGHLQFKDKKVPVSVFVSEELGSKSVGLYTTVTDFRDNERILLQVGIDTDDLVKNLPRLVKLGDPGLVEARQGFSSIAHYALMQNFAKLYKSGIEHVHLGGCETEDHDYQKMGLSAKPSGTTWVFYQNLHQR